MKCRKIEKNVFLRRSKFLHIYFKDSYIVAENIYSRERFRINEVTIGYLQNFDNWIKVSDVVKKYDKYNVESIYEAASYFLKAGLLIEKHSKNETLEKKYAYWSNWPSQAAIYHFTTRDDLISVKKSDLGCVIERAKSRPMPSISQKPASVYIPIELNNNKEVLENIFSERRTCRHFAAKEVIDWSMIGPSISKVFSCQSYAVGGVLGESLMLRSAPSGGARHPTECYLLLRRITGIKDGLYHYQPEENSVGYLQPAANDSTVRDLLCGQHWFQSANLIVFFTSKFDRLMWKYISARAYRAFLLDIGHLAQNFLIEMSSMGFGVFCTGAFKDTKVDEFIGIDSVQEGSMYVAGAGVIDNVKINSELNFRVMNS